jgi:UDP-2,3-diacylglucosamine hydrolase
VPGTFFASDIHLAPAAGDEIAPLFLSFIKDRVHGADSLYLLGDFFDYWIGPVMLHEPEWEPIFTALRELAGSGTAVTLLHGNRDFLLGDPEAASLGASIPGESHAITLGNQRLFLAHGDCFSTRDKNYQRMKKVLRNPLLKAFVRHSPHFVSNRLALLLKRQTERAVERKSSYETSIDRSAVREVMARGYDVVICGHFHKPADERLEGAGRLITLSDWTARGGHYVEFRDNALSLKFFPG